MKSGTDNSKKEHFRVIKAAELKLLYEGRQQKICESPEWAFLKALCNGRIEDADSFFGETKQFGEAASIVDVPYGRFEGKDEIHGMAKDGFWSIAQRVLSPKRISRHSRADGPLQRLSLASW